MPSRAFIDWLECTLPQQVQGISTAIATYAPLIGTSETDWSYYPPLNGYRWGAKAPNGALVMSGRSDMGAHLIMSGSALSGLENANDRIAAIIAGVRAGGGAFSRIDTAIDVTDGHLDIKALRDEHGRGRALTKAGKASMIESEAGGLTWYLGSWKSEHFARLYNKYSELAKTAELPETSDWVRVEVVNRNRYADTVAGLLNDTHDTTLTARTTILTFADFPTDRAWRLAMHGHILSVGRSLRSVPSTRRWLLGPVALSLARELVSDPDFKAEFERAVQSGIEAVQRENDRAL